MELKELTRRDREAMTALFRDVFTHAPWNDDWSDRDQLEAYMEDLAGQQNSISLGYFEGDRLVGLCIGAIRHWYTGTEYYIEEFCVDRQLQGKGIGCSFMKAIEAFLAGKQIFRIFLQTEKDVPAYAFYVHQGFQELEGHVSLKKKIDG